MPSPDFLVFFIIISPIVVLISIYIFEWIRKRSSDGR